MKILSSFDTKKDEKVLKEILEEFWDEHSFLIKRHRMYLYKMLIFWFSIMLVLSLLSIVLSYLLNTTWLWIIILLNLLGIWIWLVITFWLLEKYLKFSFFLFFYQIVIVIITILLSIWNNTGNFLNVLLNVLQIFLSLLFLYLIWRTLYVLINFEMDFVIITPKYINTYDQTWLFRRESKTIGVEKIKSIQTKKKGIIRSFFNFWEIIILTEGEENWGGEIHLKYIPYPDKIRQRIVTIMNLE